MLNPDTLPINDETTAIDLMIQDKLRQSGEVVITREYELDINDETTATLQSITHEDPTDPLNLGLDYSVQLQRMGDEDVKSILSFRLTCKNSILEFVGNVEGESRILLANTVLADKSKDAFRRNLLALVEAGGIGRYSLQEEAFQQLDIADPIRALQGQIYDLTEQGDVRIDRMLDIRKDDDEIIMEESIWTSAGKESVEHTLFAQVEGAEMTYVYMRNPDDTWKPESNDLDLTDSPEELAASVLGAMWKHIPQLIR